MNTRRSFLAALATFAAWPFRQPAPTPNPLQIQYRPEEIDAIRAKLMAQYVGPGSIVTFRALVPNELRRIYRHS